MSQMVFIHGPGAGGCGESFVHQLKHYPGSLAPTLPGHLDGKPVSQCGTIYGMVEGMVMVQR